jgi:hypothetical protein
VPWRSSVNPQVDQKGTRGAILNTINKAPGPFNRRLTMDPKIPFLVNALDIRQAHAQLQTIFPNLRQVTAATLIRHKPGRRALIEYQLETSAGPLILLGQNSRQRY